MKIYYLLFALFLIPVVSAFPSVSYNRIYIDYNTSTLITLLPNDANIWNISLYTNSQQFNFTWTGTQYELYLLFVSESDFPFVINSTEVSGEITGVFLVRKPFNVSFYLYKDKTSIIPLVSPKYLNNFAYVTAEYTDRTLINHSTYNPTLERFLTPLSYTLNYNTRVFHAPYINGKATLKLWERNKVYGIRLTDGIINFDSVYAIPNVTKGYGVNAYLGTFLFNGTNQDYTIYVSQNDLHPYRFIFNWGFLILLILIALTSVALIFMIPARPSFVFVFFIVFTGLLIIGRVVLWIIWY